MDHQITSFFSGGGHVFDAYLTLAEYLRVHQRLTSGGRYTKLSTLPRKSLTYLLYSFTFRSKCSLVINSPDLVNYIHELKLYAFGGRSERVATEELCRSFYNSSILVRNTHVSLNFQTAMARRANLSTGRHNDEHGRENLRYTRQGHGRVDLNSLSPSPAASFSSDKENQQAQGNDTRQNTDRTKDMPPPHIPTSSPVNYNGPRSGRKRKLEERDVPNASQTAHERELDDVGDRRFYDPDQSMDERRAVRKDFRDLSRELTGTHQMTSGLRKRC